jgi:hypothetical protein
MSLGNDKGRVTAGAKVTVRMPVIAAALFNPRDSDGDRADAQTFLGPAIASGAETDGNTDSGWVDPGDVRNAARRSLRP